ncbi:DUF2946 domain-containing protein [Paucibacter sp. KBW04]|uniref:DUF2946 domain-containing protein n=1 Tax=Paucibacter sp. KBW04 TaxID=2153361 RepID=UPI000F5608FC|nr:DUF2946 domain-containing protein [Paucibacter sp. KBW04]RQO53478.1 DUF2946 domain-containing protein [Paucibacter sp. KBW04]
MPFSQKIKTLISWIASCAILLMALAPALSHALQTKAPAGWVEVCTLAGTKWVKLDGSSTGSSEQEQPGSTSMKHCPCCANPAPSLGLPPTSSSSTPLLHLGFAVPELFLLAPRPLFAWAPSQARAPPLNV